MKFDINKLNWTREPEDYTISQDKIEIITKPHTDKCKWLAHDGQQPDENIFVLYLIVLDLVVAIE